MKNLISISLIFLLISFSVSQAKESFFEIFLKASLNEEIQERCLKEEVKKESELYKRCEKQFELLNELGIIKLNQEQYREALNIFKKALKISKKVLGENHRYTAYSYYNIGLVYNHIGNYNEALEYYQKALKIFRQKYGEDNIDIAQLYNNIGVVYNILGQYNEALKYYQKALKIFKQKNEEYRFDIAHSYQNIGVIYDKLRQYKKALEYYQKALKIFRQEYEEYRSDIAQLYNNIGVIYTKLRKYNEALRYYQKASKIFKQKYGEYNSNTATSYNNIGLVYYGLGNYNKALEYYHKALRIKLKILGENHPDTAISYQNIGVVYAKLGHYEKALNNFKKALRIFKQILGKNYPDTAISYNNIGVVYYNLNQYKKALNYFNKGFDIIIHNLFSNIFSLDYNLASSFYLHYKNNDFYFLNLLAYTNKNNPEFVQTSFSKWINFKNAPSLSNSFLYKLKFHDNPQVRNTANELSLLYFKLSKLQLSNTPDKQSEISKIKNKINSLKIKLQNLAPDIFSKLKTSISFKDISSILLNNELYIDFSYTNGEYFIYYIDKNYNINIIHLDKSKSEKLNNLISNIRNKIKTTIKNAHGNDIDFAINDYLYTEKEIKPYLKEIYSIIFSEIPVDKYDRLIISPDGYLATIPFEILINPKNNQYLVVSKTIVYTPSGKFFYLSRKEKKKKRNKYTYVFADPDFNLSNKSEEKKDLEEDNITKYRSLILRNLEDIRRLYGSEEEAEIIKKILGQIARLYVGKKANEDNLFRIKDARILHLATHGYFLEIGRQIDKSSWIGRIMMNMGIGMRKNVSPLELSGILLAGAKKSLEEGGDYGIVPASKLVRLNLKGTELVVLSACDTGKVKEGETISGLSIALKSAGAEYIVITLWSLDDYGARRYIEKMYKEIKRGKEYVEAITEAKREMIKNREPLIIWSPFIIIGD